MHLTLTKKPKLSLTEKMSIINSPVWPMAIDPELICKNDGDHVVRAVGIVESFLGDVKDKRFYDPDQDEAIRKEISIRGGITDSNLDFDIILLYDYLDHLEKDQIDRLVNLKDLLNKQGKIYVRCHPWSSRHGGHFYKTFNKAFIQHFLTPAELDNLKITSSKKAYQFTAPKTYEDWFKSANLKVVSAELITNQVEPIFSQLTNRGLLDPSILRSMNISFIDYILSR